MARAEIIDTCGFITDGWTAELFDELEQSRFITQYIPFDRTLRQAINKLSDEYDLFYLKFIEGPRHRRENLASSVANAILYQLE